MKSKHKHKTQLKKIHKTHHALLKKIKIILFFIAILLFIDTIVLAYNNIQPQTTILGLTLNEKSLSGLSRSQIEHVIEKEVAKNNRPLQFSYHNTIVLIYQNEVGAHVDKEKLTDQLMQVGRTGSIRKGKI